MMRRAGQTLLLLMMLSLAGCAGSSPAPSPAAAAAPLPDGRDLSEHPLDVIDLPQP
jgi:hypothetical protein